MVREELESNKLGDLIQYKNGKALEKYFSSIGRYKVISIGNYSKNSHFLDNGVRISEKYYNEIKSLIPKKNDLTMILNDKTSSGEIIGRTLLIEEDDTYVINQRTLCMTLRVNMYAKYLYYILNSRNLRKYIFDIAKPGTQIYINTPDVLAIPIKYTKNIQEQITIAETLSDVDSLIISLQKLIDKKNSIKQGAMQELLTGKRRLAGFNGIWKKKYFGEIFEFMPTNALTREQMGTVGTVKNIHYGDVLTKYGAWLDADDKTIPIITDESLINKYSSASYVRSGDIIIADTAEDNTVGKAVEIINVNTRMLSGQHTMLCRPQEKFAKRFLGYYINSVDFHNQMIPYITGIKVSSISKASLALLEMNIPPIEEQEVIAQILSDMDKEIERLEKKLAKYQLIKQGMMQELLTGHIRLVESEEPSQNKTHIIKEQTSQNHNQHFDDAVMLAGIVNAFYSDKYPLGRKKLQKLLYLLRRKEQADISSFHKKAAGPYADVVRYKGGEPIAKKNKYIEEVKSKIGSCFSKGENIQQAITYLKEWDKQQDMEWLISEFRYTKVDELELLATVDMAMCDLSQEGRPVTVQTIKDLIQSTKEWRDKLKKTYFSDSDIQRAIIKCREMFKEVF